MLVSLLEDLSHEFLLTVVCERFACVDQVLKILLFSFLLSFDKVIDSQLRPHKVNFRRYLINKLPPEPPPHNALDNGRVIPFSNKELVRLFNIIRRPHIKTVGKVNLEQKVFIKIEFHDVGILDFVLVGTVSHAKNEVIFTVGADSFGHDVGLYFGLVAFMFIGLFRG